MFSTCKIHTLLTAGVVTKTICAPYCRGNVSLFGQNAGQQCVAKSLCALLYNKIKKHCSSWEIEIMNVGNQLYDSCLCWPGSRFYCYQNYQQWWQCLSNVFRSNTVKVILVTYKVMPEYEGYEYCMPLGRALETLFELRLNDSNSRMHQCWYYL